MTTTIIAAPSAPHLFTHQFRVWRLAGFWTLHDASPHRRTPTSYVVYSAALHLCLYYAFIASMIVRLTHCTRLAEWIEDFAILPAIDCAIQSNLMYAQRHRIRQLIALSAAMDTHVGRADQRARIADEVRTSKRMSHVLCAAYAVALTLLATVAVLSADRSLIFPAWFPVDWHRGRRGYLHAALVAHQLAVLYAMALVTAARDSFAPGMYKVLWAHLVVLGEQLEVCAYAFGVRVLGIHYTNRQFMHDGTHFGYD